MLNCNNLKLKIMAKGKRVNLYINGKKLGEMKAVEMQSKKKYNINPILILSCCRYMLPLGERNSTLFN